MNINLNLLTHTLFVFKEKVLFSLTAQQKKILVIASIAFGLLAACYVGSRCFKNKAKRAKENDSQKIFPLKEEPVPQQVEKPLEKSEEKPASHKEERAPLLSDQPQSEPLSEPVVELKEKEKTTDTVKPEPVHLETPPPPPPPSTNALNQSTAAAETQPQIQPKVEPELEVHEMTDIHYKRRRERELFYHNLHFAEPHLNSKTKLEAENLKARLIKDPLTFTEAQEIYAAYKNDKQKFLKILFFLMDNSEKVHPIQLFRSILKLARACHTADPIPGFLLSDLSKKFLDQKFYFYSSEVEKMILEYFKQMTTEDFADAKLLYPILTPERVVPMMIDPTPLPGQRSNIVRVVEEGTNREISEYVEPREDALGELFNHLYREAEERFKPSRKNDDAATVA